MKIGRNKPNPNFKSAAANGHGATKTASKAITNLKSQRQQQKALLSN